MPRLAPSSRRALVGAAALAALAPATGAKRKKKKRKKPPQPLPPLAFAVGTLVDVGPDTDQDRFDVTIQLAFIHPASGVKDASTVSAQIAIPASDAQLRAAIADQVRGSVAFSLEFIFDQDVPPDRIAVAVM